MSVQPEKLKVRCPRCKEWATWKDNPFRPFCSEECQADDLGKWATEAYRIPVQEQEVAESEVSSPKNKEEE